MTIFIVKLTHLEEGSSPEELSPLGQPVFRSMRTFSLLLITVCNHSVAGGPRLCKKAS